MEIKPHAKLTGTLRILLKITIGVTAIAVLAGFYDFYSYSALPSDVDANEAMLPSDAVTAIVGLVQFIFAIITGITFLRWIYRSNKNLRALSGESMMFTPGWSVGWYFVPIANIWMPYQVMKEIWIVSHKRTTANHSVVGWWWTLSLISIFLGWLTFKLVMRADDAGGYAVSAMAAIISDGLDVILNIVALVMVTRIGIAYSQNIVEPAGAAYGGSAVVLPDVADLSRSVTRRKRMSGFKFNCPHCNQSLEAPVEMLGETIECPDCNGSIELPAPDPTPAPQIRKTPVRVVTPHLSTPETAASWYYSIKGKCVGPIGAEQIRSLAAQGVIDNATLVWREGFNNWIPIEQTTLRLDSSALPPLTG